jgi:hypothetical protein
VRQRFDPSRLDDLEGEVARGFAAHGAAAISPGQRVAITAGSRGVASIARIVRAVAAEVRRLGAEPFVVAAMGSHGGATAEGQRAVLAGYGVTEDAIGCPVVSSMETVALGEPAEGFTVYVDRAAHEADAIVLLNRVKPHSILSGELGSGLLKMAGIGLGKRDGADSIHREGVERNLVPAARMVLQRSPVRLGVAILENSLDETRKIVTVPADRIEEADRALQAEAQALLPNLPFDPLDLLIVDRIGKNYSGTGMDPNVIGMHRRVGGPPRREIRRIVALGLSDESHGNANGVGMADVITERLRGRIDWEATYVNAVTADFLAGAKLPVACPTARDAVALAMRPFDPLRVRAVRVRDTAHLEELWVSEALLADVALQPLLQQTGPPEDMRFEPDSGAQPESA